MKTKLLILTAALLGAAAPAVRAQQAQPILSVSMTEIDVFQSGASPTLHRRFWREPPPGLPTELLFPAGIAITRRILGSYTELDR